MGIVLKQSFRNTLIIYLAFMLGGINVIFLYPAILQSDFYGLVTFLLSSTNIITPLAALGVQFTIVKFFSSYQTKKEQDQFLSSVIFLPLLVALPLGFFWDYVHTWIMKSITESNKSIENYTFSIYIIAVCCAYFELFYSWTKVQLNTVFGNLMKELWNRIVIMLLLTLVFLNIITKEEYIFWLTIAYVLRMLIMMGYAFYVYLPKFYFSVPKNFSEIIKYSLFIILAGSASAIILDIDKVMIPGKETFQKAAYYTVAVFIGSFIEAPSRAMAQILQPLTSKSLNEANTNEVENLYKKSSINLFLVGGLFFLLINCSVQELFKLMPEKGYAGGEYVVLMISLAKLYVMLMGSNGAILVNSKFYKITLPLGIGSALTVYLLNKLFYYNLDFGTNGLALATLITWFMFNTFKIIFVHRKFKIHPFSKETWQLMAILIVLFCSFYFWNFSFPAIKIYNFDISPVFNLIAKAIIITVIYLFVSTKLSISNQVNDLIKKVIKL